MRFRKKPVVIEAFQMTEAARYQMFHWPQWLKDAWVLVNPGPGSVTTNARFGDQRLVISTLEGVHLVDWNDWIIRGVKGELYPCKPDIFDLTYEPAE